MVQIKSLMVAMIVAIAPVAQAWNCTPGRRYCGWNLSRFNFDDDRWAPAIGLATLASALHLIRISFNRLPILIIVEETRPLPKANLRSTTISTTRDHAL
ncbi:hypothetical protein E4U12_007510 [Claviceps purpurea]|nr:hypothetical protein E4U12_007510 [Claviceps purpurea]